VFHSQPVVREFEIEGAKATCADPHKIGRLQRHDIQDVADKTQGMQEQLQ
jgi:hypothetical protein